MQDIRHCQHIISRRLLLLLLLESVSWHITRIHTLLRIHRRRISISTNINTNISTCTRTRIRIRMRATTNCRR